MTILIPCLSGFCRARRLPAARLFMSLALGLMLSQSALAADTWTSTGSLATPRRMHTATILANGKVLAVGGHYTDDLYSVEIYDPTNGTWSGTGDLIYPAAYFTATRLPNGQVLVTGGQLGAAYLYVAQLYDPSSGLWSENSYLTMNRSRHTATLLPNGKVLVAGGWTYPPMGDDRDSLDSCEIYDPSTSTWSNTGFLANKRFYHTANLLTNGKILVAGGRSGASISSALDSAELYDPLDQVWSSTKPMVTGRSRHSATLLNNGKVLVVGGQSATDSPYLASAEVYDPETGTWSKTGSLITGRMYHSATLLNNGKVLVAGGATDSSLLASAEVYEPDTGTWSNTESLITDRESHSATLLINGKVLVAGGHGNTDFALDSAELYNGPPKGLCPGMLEFLLLQ